MLPDSSGKTQIISIFACENQPVVTAGLSMLLSGYPDLRLAGHAETMEETAVRIGLMHCDVLLAGQPPGMRSALHLLAEIRHAALQIPVVIWVAGMSEMDTFRALQMGARGILLRTQTHSVLADCIRSVHAGEVWLDPLLSSRGSMVRSGVRITPRERQIINLICRGLKNRDIAASMGITPGTVKVHLMHIFEKTGVRDRFQLALQGKEILAAADGALQSRTAGA